MYFKVIFYIWDGGRTEILITEMSPKKFVRRPLAFSQHRFIQFLSLTDWLTDLLTDWLTDSLKNKKKSHKSLAEDKLKSFCYGFICRPRVLFFVLFDKSIFP